MSKIDKSEVRTLYDYDIHPPPELREYLVKVLHNHMVFYNHMLQHYAGNRLMSLIELKKLARRELATGQFSPYIAPALFSDIHYLWKKNNFRQKLFTSIQYMTVVLSRWDYTALHYDQQSQTLHFAGGPQALKLSTPLPPFAPNTQCYFTLSYAPSSNNFRIVICPIGGVDASEDAENDALEC